MHRTHPSMTDAGSPGLREPHRPASRRPAQVPTPAHALPVIVAPKRPRSGDLCRFAVLSAPSHCLPLDVHAVGRIRHWATDKAAAWGVKEDGLLGLELIVSELVTNALVHTRPDERSVQVRLLHQVPADTGTRGLVWLEVCSSASTGGTVPAVVRTLPAAAAGEADLPEHGRGMQLVDALATTWGVDPAGEFAESGHVVWAQPDGADAPAPAAVA